MAIDERTFIAVKPVGVNRGLIGVIISRFERRGYKLVALKKVIASREMLEEHYKHLRRTPFFSGNVAYMASAPVVAMVWEGEDVVAQGRAMLGAVRPGVPMPGTIRGDFSQQPDVDGFELCHGSDSVDAAVHEIAIWFRPEELIDH